jgi:hypothetical protein
MLKQFDNVDIPGLKIDGRGLGLISTSLVAIPNELLRVLTPGSFRVSLEAGWKQRAQDGALCSMFGFAMERMVWRRSR